MNFNILKSAKQKICLINIICLALFIFDQLLKRYSIQSFGNKEINLISSAFKFRFSPNTGIAFSLQLKEALIYFLVAIIIVCLLYFLRKSYHEQHWLYVFSFTLVLAGAVSNLIDRISFGFVIDYFDMQYFTVFNLADVMIVTGALILVFSNIDLSKKKR